MGPYGALHASHQHQSLAVAVGLAHFDQVGDHEDLVDSTTQAIMRFRQGGLLSHPEDYVEEMKEKKKRIYY